MMIPFCNNQRKNTFKERYFIYLHSSPEHDEAKTANSVSPESNEKVKKPEDPKASAEAESNLRKQLLARHAKLARRIKRAEKKYRDCLVITSAIPSGTSPRESADEDCKKAGLKLKMIEAGFPDSSELVIGKPEAIVAPKPEQKTYSPSLFDDTLTNIGRSTRVVSRKIVKIHEYAKDAVGAANALKKIGLNDGMVKNIFNKYPSAIVNIIKTLTEFKDGGGSKKFSKIIAKINDGYPLEKFASDANYLKKTHKLSTKQIVNVLSSDRFLSGIMTIQNFSEYVKLAEAKKVNLNNAIALLSLIDQRDNPENYFGFADKGKNISKKSEKLQFVSDLKLVMMSTPPSMKGLSLLYDTGESISTISAFFKRIEGLDADIGTKVALFEAERDPVKAVEFFSKAQKYASEKGNSTVDAVQKMEWSSLYKSFPEVLRSEKSAEMGRLLKNNPGLYPFMALQVDRTSGDKVKFPEYLEFSKDPAFPIAIEIYKKMVGNKNIDIKKSLEQIAIFFKLAKTLQHRGLKAEDIATINLKSEFKKLRAISVEKNEMELYRYKDKDGVYVSRQVVSFAHNEHTPLRKTSRFLDANLRKNIDANGGLLTYTFMVENPITFREKSVKEKRRALKEFKKNLLNSIVNSKPPATFLFTGHMDGDGIQLTKDYEVVGNPSNNISAKEFANAIKRRSEHHKFSDLLSKDIYRFAGCATPGLTDEIYRLVRIDRSIAPMIGGATGRGIGAVIDTPLIEKNFQLGTGKPVNPKLKHINGGHSSGSTNASYMFAPDKDGNPVKIF